MDIITATDANRRLPYVGTDGGCLPVIIIDMVGIDDRETLWYRVMTLATNPATGQAALTPVDIPETMIRYAMADVG